MTSILQPPGTTTTTTPHRSTPSTTFLLTQNLRATLQTSRDSIDQWVDHQMRAADRHGTAAARRLSQQQRALDAASTQLLALQLERGCRLNTTTGSNTSNNEKNQTTGTANASSADGDDTTIQILEQRVQQQTTANARLDDELAETKRTLHEAQSENQHQTACAMAAKEQVASVSMAKMVTVDDLTRGSVNYKCLGLDFEKADFEGLRICFTQLDPAQPDRKFSFCLEIQDADKHGASCGGGEDVWTIVNCDPPVLSQATVDALVVPFNETNDMRSMVQAMRQAFVEFVVNEKTDRPSPFHSTLTATPRPPNHQVPR